MLPPGSDFAGYRIECPLGRGGMADVYLARHPRLPRSYALKLMSEELSRNEVYRQRFNSEADIACLVQHESVVRVYDRGEDDDRLWLAMEYVKGPDLAHIIRSEGHLTPERSVALLERIAAGLDAIHALGLLHRDVKPANILVGNDDLGAERALLTDFGIAKSAADSLGLTGVGDVVATLHYAAPEQFELRSGELDRRVDVYALGCVLHEMLTGKASGCKPHRRRVRWSAASHPGSTPSWKRRSASVATAGSLQLVSWPAQPGPQSATPPPATFHRQWRTVRCSPPCRRSRPAKGAGSSGFLRRWASSSSRLLPL
jgi:serine/threonine protein kinase